MVQMLGAATVKQQFMLQDLYPITGKEKLPMSSTFNGRQLKAARKREALRLSGGEVKFVEKGTCLEHPEMAAWFSLLAARAQQSGEIVRPNELTYLCPAASEVAVNNLLQGEQLTTELDDWKAQLEPVRNAKRARAFICSSVQRRSLGPSALAKAGRRKTGRQVLRLFAAVLAKLSQESTGSAPTGGRHLGRRS